MSCPACDHTMQQLAYVECVGIFWCPRCGTVRNDDGQGVQDFTPELVERCRQFQGILTSEIKPLPDASVKHWKRLSIAEAINRPEDRPT